LFLRIRLPLPGDPPAGTNSANERSVLSTVPIDRSLLLPTCEPSLLLTRAVLCLGSGHHASGFAGKIYANIAFDKTSPIALAAAQELHAVTDVAFAESE
jgi:hypothetical protein